MSEPTLPQLLGLWKWSSETLANDVRKDTLLPRASAEMPSGSRMPIIFGGRFAGWANMPEPAQKAAYVSDEAKLLAWAKIHYPEKIEHPVEVKVDAGLIEFLQEHRPESLHTGERVDPQWVADIRQALADKDKGYYLTAKGEKLTEVPGIKVPEPELPVPHVKLEKNAGEIIRAAIAAGEISFSEVLALPSGEASGAS